MHRFIEPNLGSVGESTELSPSNARIARAVLRFKRGSRVELLDGRGGTALAEISSFQKERGLLRILDRKEASRPWPALALVQALPKGDKAAWVIQKAVELGTERIVFVQTEQGSNRREKASPRWSRVAEEALRQSGNPFLPEITGPLPLSEALRGIPRGLSIILDESERSRFFRDLLAQHPSPSIIHLAVGPEGGWSAGDRASLENSGFIAVRLGPYVLRTETASTAALAACRATWG